MKTYEKPLVMVNNDLAEGVYAASGVGNNTVISSKYTLTRKYAGDRHNMYEQYIIKFPYLPEIQHLVLHTDRLRIPCHLLPCTIHR